MQHHDLFIVGSDVAIRGQKRVKVVFDLRGPDDECACHARANLCGDRAVLVRMVPEGAYGMVTW